MLMPKEACKIGGGGELLTCDFGKYSDIVVTGSVDKSIKIWVFL
jgi:WD40 repeat protein